MSKIHAIYASTSGNVELVIDTIAQGWREKGHDVKTHRAEVTSFEVIKQNQLFLFGASTWDHGIINPFFDPLMKQLENYDCSGKSAFFVGCGDFRYEMIYFNMGIQKLLELWKKNGGSELLHPLKINDDPLLSMEKLIKPWMEKALEHVPGAEATA